jgi:hypothetical protein
MARARYIANEFSVALPALLSGGIAGGEFGELDSAATAGTSRMQRSDLSARVADFTAPRTWPEDVLPW